MASIRSGLGALAWAWWAAASVAHTASADTTGGRSSAGRGRPKQARRAGLYGLCAEAEVSTYRQPVLRRVWRASSASVRWAGRQR
jgi:hypothetical protein